jgi:dihydrolipoamide dehydrogenase
MNYDLCIIGSGPGGYVAAIRAGQLGLKVCIIEANHLGGICLNWGCIPTKALLKTSEMFLKSKKLGDYGLKLEGEVKFDIAQVVKRSRDVAAKLSGGIGMLLKKNKVEVINGFGKIEKAGVVGVYSNDKKEREVLAKNIIIATGAKARVLPGFEPDGKLVWTYREAMTPDKFPNKIAVVGSGAIGSEFASFYNNMGAEVYVLEALNKILPTEDEEISKIAQKAFEKQGMKIETGVKLEKIEKKTDSLVIYYNGKNIEVDRLIMAVGVVPNSSNIGLENTKIKTDERGIIQTNEWGETGEPGIWAIGDVVKGPWLAHKASHEGIIAVEKIANVPTHPLKYENIPGCIYTYPQVASVGLSEAKAKEKYSADIKIGRFSSIANGKSIAISETDGLVKVIYHAKTGELLGAHLIGAEVTELLSTYLIAKTGELVEKDVIHTIFPHPTLSEMLHEATLDAFGQVIHM